MNASSPRLRWAVVAAFAVAMAWVEAACVFYIRTLVDRIEPYQPQPLPIAGALGAVELWREAATLVMIAAVGWLAAASWRQRAGYAALAFGVWDVFYYAFLRVMSGWPASVFDWDVLFLIPLPWWGPVLAPVCIALVMVAWGTLVTLRDDVWEGAGAWMCGAVGVTGALALFMADAWRALPGGREAVLQTLPEAFNWPVFLACLLLLSMPLLRRMVAPRRHAR